MRETQQYLSFQFWIILLNMMKPEIDLRTSGCPTAAPWGLSQPRSTVTSVTVFPPCRTGWAVVSSEKLCSKCFLFLTLPFPLCLPLLILALRMKIREVKKENGDKKIVPKKKKPLKLGPIKKKELKRLVLFLKNGADCPCHQLDNLSHNFLIMGRKVKSQYLLTAIHKWDKGNKEFKNFMKKMKNHECPTFQSVFK